MKKAKTAQDIELKQKEVMLRVLSVGEHLGVKFMIQQVKDFFQYIVHYNGQWFQGYNVIIPKEGKNYLTDEEVAQVAFITKQQATSTIETLVKKGEKKH